MTPDDAAADAAAGGAVGGRSPAGVRVRPAGASDAAEVVAAVTALLRELRGDAEYVVPGLDPATVGGFVADPARGGVLLAESSVRAAPAAAPPLGVLGYSLPVALRTAGPYCLIQELWVADGHRGRGIAAALLAALEQRCAAAGLDRVEVGLPAPAFPDAARAHAFYLGQGFRILGPRARKELR